MVIYIKVTEFLLDGHLPPPFKIRDYEKANTCYLEMKRGKKSLYKKIQSIVAGEVNEQLQKEKSRVEMECFHVQWSFPA